MSIANVVLRGYGNGTVPAVVVTIPIRGYTSDLTEVAGIVGLTSTVTQTLAMGSKVTQTLAETSTVTATTGLESTL